jgi:integrase
MKVTLKRFSDIAISKRCKPQEKRYSVTEGDGLYLEISPKGGKTWKHYGKTRKWHTLGRYPAMTVKEARIENERAKKNTDRGRPAVNKETLNRNSKFKKLYKEWIGKAVNVKGVPWSDAHKRNVEYMLEADVLPTLKDVKLKDIHRSDVRGILDAILERDADNQALQVYRRLTRMFNYAAENDYIDLSPMVHMPVVGSSKKKDRYLKDKEIATFLNHLPDADMATDTASALEIILRTGQRPSEVTGAHKSEIQDDWWTIPAERTKNKLEHRVFLPARVKELFGDPNKHGYYFPSLRKPKQPLSHLVLSKALRRSLTGNEKKKGDDITIPIKELFTPHDLRRTCATGLGALRYIDEVIGSVLNHKKQSVTGIYNRYQYDIEKQKALEAWDRKLAAIMSGKKSDNVVSITG